MPRPTTKEQLLKEIVEERGKLEALLATIPSDVFATKKVLGEWTTKDIVSHLIAWEQMVILWVKSGIEGKTIPVPAEGFKWSDLPALNESIFRAHQNEAVEEVQNKFKDSYLANACPAEFHYRKKTCSPPDCINGRTRICCLPISNPA